MNYILTEQHIYVSARLGVDRRNVDMIAASTPSDNVTLAVKRGEKHYELSNHLGNVLATVSDKKIAVMSGANLSYYRADVVSYSDYYPFGAPMTERTALVTPTDVRYGFNGKEVDSEGMGGGLSTYDYGFRICNPNIAKFLSTDPLSKEYPELSVYQFASNTPVCAIDLDGLEAKLAIYGAGTDHGGRKENHHAQFKREAERDVKWKNAEATFSVLTGASFLMILKEQTKERGFIEYLSIFSYSSNESIIVDNGQYSHEKIGFNSFPGYVNTNLDLAFRDEGIEFSPDALLIFAGCNSSYQGKEKSYSLYITLEYKIATIGSDGLTSPTKSGGNRRSVKGYYLNYYDENDKLVTLDLGKDLTDLVIDRAKVIVESAYKVKFIKSIKPDFDSSDEIQEPINRSE
ncbi:MAG: RHS repeat domain-containing protein [Flavobacteriales bacterium]